MINRWSILLLMVVSLSLPPLSWAFPSNMCLGQQREFLCPESLRNHIQLFNITGRDYLLKKITVTKNLSIYSGCRDELTDPRLNAFIKEKLRDISNDDLKQCTKAINGIIEHIDFYFHSEHSERLIESGVLYYCSTFSDELEFYRTVMNKELNSRIA